MKNCDKIRCIDVSFSLFFFKLYNCPKIIIFIPDKHDVCRGGATNPQWRVGLLPVQQRALLRLELTPLTLDLIKTKTGSFTLDLA